MTGRHVALLRGINVGRAKRIAMADLRTVIERLGYGEVRTLLNSGNVVFRAPPSRTGDHGARIQQAVEHRLGVSSRVTVLTATELALAIDQNPWAGADPDPSRLLVAVLGRAADRPRLQRLAEDDWTPERLGVGRRVGYLWCPAGIAESRLMKAVERLLGDGVTSRNWATMLKLNHLASET